MKPESTPEYITDKIKALCNGQIKDFAPIYIPVEPKPWSKMQDCFNNVPKVIKMHGGEQINGWIVWQWANIFIELEAHAVWKSPEGQLIDITPHDGEEKKILFLKDDKIIYSGQRIDNIRRALTDSPLVAEYIKISKEIISIINNGKLSHLNLELLQELNLRKKKLKISFIPKQNLIHYVHVDLVRNIRNAAEITKTLFFPHYMHPNPEAKSI